MPLALGGGGAALGALLLVDFRSTDEYASRLRERGVLRVVHRTLGWRFWYGGPWTASTLVTAQKPAVASLSAT